MPCLRCDERSMNSQHYDPVDGQHRLNVGVWHWVSRCPVCGTMMYEPVERLSVNARVPFDSTSTVLVP